MYIVGRFVGMIHFIKEDYDPHDAASQRFENLLAYYLLMMNDHKDWWDKDENVRLKIKLQELGRNLEELNHDIREVGKIS